MGTMMLCAFFRSSPTLQAKHESQEKHVGSAGEGRLGIVAGRSSSF